MGTIPYDIKRLLNGNGLFSFCIALCCLFNVQIGMVENTLDPAVSVALNPKAQIIAVTR